MEVEDALFAWIDMNETLQVVPLDECFKVKARADDEFFVGLFLFHLLLLFMYLVQIQFQHMFVVFDIFNSCSIPNFFDPAIMRLATVEALQLSAYLALFDAC